MKGVDGVMQDDASLLLLCGMVKISAERYSIDNDRTYVDRLHQEGLLDETRVMSYLTKGNVVQRVCAIYILDKILDVEEFRLVFLFDVLLCADKRERRERLELKMQYPVSVVPNDCPDGTASIW